MKELIKVANEIKQWKEESELKKQLVDLAN